MNVAALETRQPSASLTGKARALVKAHPYAAAGAATVGALAVMALVNRRLASKAEHDNPPRGRFLNVDGVRLHYVERGTGVPLVLLHGNGGMIEDFESSGLIDLAARDYRVIAIDRPGFGHSDRPRNVVWTPTEQAALINAALRRLGVSRALVLGHSWGAAVAIAMALQDPTLVEGLVLESGYYYPTLRSDVLVFSAPALPLLGAVLAHTLAPIGSRLIWPLLMARIFGPQPVPEKFKAFPKEMAVRPSQIRASAEESALMIPDAASFRHRYADLQMPVAIVAGDEDRMVDLDAQSARLHREVSQSRLHCVPANGHMVHQTATAAVMFAINDVAGRAGIAKRPVSAHAVEQVAG